MIFSLTFLLLLFSVISLKTHGLRVGTIGYFASTAFCLLALFAYSAWSVVKDAAGPGLLSFVTLNENQLHSLEQILFCIALGSFLGNFTLGRYIPLQDTFRVFDSMTRESKTAKWVVSISLLIGYLAEGSSIFFRETYLSSNGIPILARTAGAILLPSLCLVAFVVLKSPSGSRNVLNNFVLGLGFALLLGKGSRAAVVLFVFYLILFLSSPYSRKSKVFLICASPLVLYFVFGLVLESRIGAHGIFLIPQNMFEVIGSINAFDLLKYALGLSLSWVIVVPLSLGTVTGDRLIQNLNPLLSSGANPFDFGSGGTERLYPYRWVPASSAGQIYEVIGFIGMLAIFYILTLVIQGSLLLKQHQRGLSLMQISILGFYFFQFPIFLQYSSRNWFRVLLLIFVIVFISLLSQTQRHSKKVEAQHA